MSDPLTLRPAMPADADWAVALMQATIGPIGWRLSGAENDQAATQALRPFFREGGNRLSFDRVLVAELAGRAAALALSYPGDAAPALDAPFRARLRALGLPERIETEAEPGEWYLDTLATRPEFRGQGLGRALVEGVAAQALQAGHTRLGLLVDRENHGARRLYGRLGFQQAGERTLTGSPYLHLVLGLKRDEGVNSP